MKLGFTPINAMMLDVQEAFRLAVELQCHHLELTHDLHELFPVAQDVALVNELQRATGVGVTVHLSYVDLNLASGFPGVRENSLERSKRGLEYAAKLNAHCAVLHSGLVPMRHPMVLPLALDALAASLAALPKEVPIALENLALDGFDVLRGVAQLEAVSTTAGIGNTLDFGHAVVEGCSTERFDGVSNGGLEAGMARLEDYKRGLSNTIHLHLHDNDGTSDQHLDVGKGRIVWRNHADYLRGFAGTVTLEVPDPRESVRALREALA